MPSITKDRISSPLEAGPSLLDAELSPVFTSALEYVSSRLAKKKLQLSLIVVRKDVQLPTLLSPEGFSKRSESPSASSFTTSPSRSLFSAPSFTRSLGKQSSISSLSETASDSSTRTSSPTPSSPSSIWSMSPGLPTPPPNPWGLTLLRATSLTDKAEKILRKTIEKTEKKFSIGSGWLPTNSIYNKSTCPVTNDLIRRSLAQNHILFSSEGLTLLSLDHVYTFKCQLHTYSTTLIARDLTLAVDELRRLVLVQQGHRITKGYLTRAYPWLGVSLAALVDINEGYKIAYGGRERHGGIEVLNEERKTPSSPMIKLQTNFAMTEIKRMRFTTACYDDEEPMKIPDLMSEISNNSGEEDDVVEFGESAKGRDEELREDRGPHRRGPQTPNGYEDITPVTKGEWCFLMVGDGWKEGRRAAVETC